VEPNDGQESYVGNESNVERDGDTSQKPLFNNIHPFKPCVSTLDTIPTFVFGVIISQGGYELGAMPSALNGGVQG
jgi:hypothetical protein